MIKDPEQGQSQRHQCPAYVTAVPVDQEQEESNKHAAMGGTVIPQELRNAARLFPRLTAAMKKIDCGKVAVIGGALQYTGAPYYASFAPLKMVGI